MARFPSCRRQCSWPCYGSKSGQTYAGLAVALSRLRFGGAMSSALPDRQEHRLEKGVKVA